MIDMAFSSVRRTHKNVCCYVLSDNSTDVSDVPNAEAFIGFQVTERAKKLALESPSFNKLPGGFLRRQGLALVAGTSTKFEAQLAFLEAKKGEFQGHTNVIFMDSDMLVLRSVSSLFNTQFSVALTPQNRDRENQAINAGFIAVHNKDIAGAIEFFKQTVATCYTILDEVEKEGTAIGILDQRSLGRTVNYFGCNKVKWIGIAPATLAVKFLANPIQIHMAPAIRYNCKAVFGGGCDRTTSVYHFSVMRKAKIPKVWKMLSQGKESAALKMAGMRDKSTKYTDKKAQSLTYNEDCRPSEHLTWLRKLYGQN